MVERALLCVLVAVAIMAALSGVAHGVELLLDRAQCGLERANVCVLDDAKETD